MRQKFGVGRWIVCSALMATLSTVAPAQIEYPKTKKIGHVDDYHGVKVADPYRWLEDDVRNSKEVADWVEAENKVTFAYLESIPERKAIEERLTELWNYEKFSSPFKVGGRYYYYKNDGLQNQAVLYTQESLAAEPKVLIDPNEWSKDGTVALAGTAFSDDGRYIAYGLAEAGSDWNTWRVMRIDSREVLPDEIKWVKFSNTSWTKDGKGFFYSRYDEPPPGEKLQSLNHDQKVFYHRAGTPQADDVLVHARPDHPDWGFLPEVTEDGRYLVITVWKGTDDRFQVYYRDLDEPYAAMTELIGNFDNEYSFIANDGPVFFFKTGVDAERRRVIAIDIRQPERANWKEIIPQASEKLESAGLVGNLFVASYLKDAKTQVKLYDLRGELVRDVDLPGIVTASGFNGRRTDTETFYSVQGFTSAPSIFRYDLISGKSTKLREAKIDADLSQYETSQVFFNSKDGARVPMFIAHKKGIKLDHGNPTLLYGYGGFNISLTPAFSISRLAWMEMGGVLAVANLRGGGEYGEAWHKAGTMGQKQNVFDDFIAAAQYLIEKGYTSKEKLGIQGGSNGGLLVGAAITQRPELFGAALPAVGVMDMLRFHKFTAGRFWVDDYGSADNPDEFKALYEYSPYHNIDKGASYPATLIITADTDDRVVPGHSFKFAAAIQEAQAGKAPVLIRIETRAGHGAGKPTAKQIEEVADQWAFLVKNLGLKLPEGYGGSSASQ